MEGTQSDMQATLSVCGQPWVLSTVLEYSRQSTESLCASVSIFCK